MPPKSTQKSTRGTQSSLQKQSQNADTTATTTKQPFVVRAAADYIKENASDEQPVEYTFLTLYLTLYNWLSAILWAAILGRVLLTVATLGHESVNEQVGGLLMWTQSLAATEVIHSSFGVVRANFFTTFMQVLSRLILVWGIVYRFPAATTPSPAFTTMLLAWSATETIRYSYFTGLAAYGGVPWYLKWLRYNTFVVLYPVGIASEVWLIVLATVPAREVGVWWERGMFGVLAFYAPGSWILFNHMLRQRRKMLSAGPDKKKTT